MGVGGGVLTPFLVPCAGECAAPKMRNVGGIAQTLSIHAPARARQYTDSISLNRGAFNPRASKGATKAYTYSLGFPMALIYSF